MKPDKILFRSSDGEFFELFIDGIRIDLTQGIVIKAGGGESVTVTVNLALTDGHSNFK